MSDWSVASPRAIHGLLGDGLLEGQHEVSTDLRPERLARPVQIEDFAAVLTEIARLCQVWGGAGQPLLPVRDGVVSTPYGRLLDTEQVDGVGGLQDVQVELPFRVAQSRPWDFPALMIAAHEPRDRWRPIEVCSLDSDDPWRPIYGAVLGTLPTTPSAELSKLHHLREDLQFDEIVPVRHVAVRGSLDDLISRITNGDVITPRRFANMFLAYGLEPDTSFLGEGQSPLPRPYVTRRAAGPNIIVALTEGSVDDLALLWNLRAAHGDRRVLPIGLPADQITPDALRVLQEPGRATMFGFGGGKCHLVSCSVPVDTLVRLVAASPGALAVPYEDVLTYGPAPGRPRSHVSTWQGGRTRLDPISDADREVLRNAQEGVRSASLILDVKVTDSPLPRDPTMRGTEFWARFQAGAAQVSVPWLSQRETVEVAWPSSWTCLAAVAQTRGLDVRESQAGIAAATLIRGLGEIGFIRWLAHHGLIELLYRMAELSGMAWWKRRWKETVRELRASGADPVALERAAELLGRDDPVVAPPGEGRAVSFEEFVSACGGEPAAQRWVSWAERRHLLVRGADIRCPACGASAWLPMAAVPPPIACVGCGREILQPYGPRDLRFTYRVGEPLRRVLETDSLGHVLALRWLVELFQDRGLVGAHPGVEFVDPGTGQVVGEADVILLFTDGTLVPVEVKRRRAGVDQKAQNSMNKVADVLEAPWDVLVVTEPARKCEAIRVAERRLPDRPRLLLTTDQLFEDQVYSTLGVDPFAWDPLTQEQDDARDAAFADQLRERDPDQTWDYVSEGLLDRTAGAFRFGPVAEERAAPDDDAEPS
ncbi:hypothetical protein [Amycolatopsis sp. cmx-8-4]|uniref:hypothetical protein n=1 Tax=Amycolatopsis sp. cmx-8-4 TaxID=2790947 RepID=UPI00397B66D1